MVGEVNGARAKSEVHWHEKAEPDGQIGDLNINVQFLVDNSGKWRKFEH